MAQRVGQVSGDAERAPQPDDVDSVGLRQQIDRFLQVFRLGARGQLLHRLRVGAGELVQDVLRTFRHDVFHLPKQTRPIGVAGGFLHQIHAEQLFHFIETAEIEGVGEADKRGGRYVRLLGDHRHGVERHAVGVVQHVTRHLLQTLAQGSRTVRGSAPVILSGWSP